MCSFSSGPILKKAVLAGVLFAGVLLPGRAAEEMETPSWHRVRVTMAQYCYECHGGFLTEGGVDLLAQREEATIAENPELWADVVQALRNHYMPSEDGRPMPVDRRDELIRGIDDRLVAMTEAGHPRSTSLRRLNRTQLNNTLRALLFVDEDFTKDLPPDDSGYGFDTTADVLTVSPLLMEKYLELAAEAGDMACPSPGASRTLYVPAVDYEKKSSYHIGDAVVISSTGMNQAVRTTLNLSPGVYDFEWVLAAQQAGGEKARAAVHINGQKLQEFSVESGQDDKPNRFPTKLRVLAKGAKPREGSVLPAFETPLKVAITFENDYYRPENPEGQRDRNLIVAGVGYTGPREQTADDLHTAFIEYYFGADLGQLDPRQIRTGIFRFASNAYRKPASKDLVNTLWAVYQENLKGENPDRRAAMRAVIDAVFASPHFLFRHEPGDDTDPFVLASWLAYFIWSAPPDDRLYELAKKNQLHANLDTEITRMLADPKARALTENFAAQWLEFRDLPQHWADGKVYEGFNGSVKWSMRRETERFVSDLIENDRSLLLLLDADYTFADQRLAEFYGLPDKPKGFQKVSLADTPRRGIWSQGSVLTVTSHPRRTSPVKRGKWILENLLGLSPPPPPNNVPSLKETGDGPAPASLRESMAQHRDNPDCRSCHAIMDPFGLALETYNGVGQWRSEKELAEVRPETVFDGTTLNSPVDLARYLVEEHREDFIQNVARKLTIYATGRGVTWRDRAALERITAATAATDYRFSALVKAIVFEYAPGLQHRPPAPEMALLDKPKEVPDAR